MTQYNTLNAKLSNWLLNKLKSGIKNGIESNFHQIVGDSNNENNFKHKLLLTNTQVSKLCKTFVNNSSANSELSNTQLDKVGQSGGLLGRLLGPLCLLPLIGYVVKPIG